ncbi:MAG: YihY/virulence factor BrkB family protein [Ilumatobacter sp.]|nr:YihY/virulence factor BrkB family protein [Ilumatobacter sp.]
MTDHGLASLFRQLRDIVLDTYASWRNDRTIRLGAGLAYYGLFSLTSVIAVALGLLRIFGRSATVEDDLTQRVVAALGPDAAAAVSSFFDQVDGSTGTSIGLIGVGSLLVTGSLFFLALEDAFHQIWEVPVRSGIRSTMRRRLISLAVLLGAASTIVVALAVQAAASVLERLVPGSAPGLQAVSALFASMMSWSVLVVALALLFKYLPSVGVPWRPIVLAALITSAFLVVGTALIGWYLRTVGASSVGGVASTPIAVLLWIYYEAQILLAGVQLSRILTERRVSIRLRRRPVEPVESPREDDRDA